MSCYKYLFVLMSFLICEKHNKNEKSVDRALANGLICMNKYCPQSFKVFCSMCKNQHRDHSNKVLSLLDASFLVGRLLKSPAKQMTKPLNQTLEIMKKLKFIKQFRKKIFSLEKQIQKNCLELINQTQSVLNQFSNCKQGASNLQILFNNIGKTDNYKKLTESSRSIFQNLDYNQKKDKLQLGNNQTKQKQDKRRKAQENTKRKIQEVRDYSMKIIEVIFHNEDSEDEQDDILYKKKHYQVLKSQLFLKIQEQLNQSEDLKSSRSTVSKSAIKPSSINKQCQTQTILYTPQQFHSKIQEKVAQLKQSHNKSQIDFRHKLHAATRQKENLSRQLNRLKQKFDEKRKSITHIQTQLRYNKGIRSEYMKARDDLMNKFIQVWPIRYPDNQDKND